MSDFGGGCDVNVGALVAATSSNSSYYGGGGSGPNLPNPHGCGLLGLLLIGLECWWLWDILG